MANKICKMNVSNDMQVAGNFDPAAIPADDDVLFFNDQTEQAPTVGMTFAAKNFDVVVEKGCKFPIGASGSPLKPDTFGRIIYEGSANDVSFFEAGAAGGATQVMVNTTSTKRGVVNLAAIIKKLNVRLGSCEIKSGATIDTTIAVESPGGSQSPELIIQSGVTLSGVECALTGGRIECSSDIPSVRINRGEFRLLGIADISTIVEIYDGGSLLWEAFTSSSINLVELYGGLFQTLKDRLGRTLTHLNMYGKGQADFRSGGLSLSITDSIEVFGENQPLFPKGARYTVTV